jgi:hypothetical protein
MGGVCVVRCEAAAPCRVCQTYWEAYFLLGIRQQRGDTIANDDTLFDLTGKTAVVTGASSGLGVTFASLLVERGAALAGLRRLQLYHRPYPGRGWGGQHLDGLTLHD